MKRYLDYLWPIIGLVAVVWSVDLLWDKLKTEAGTDAAIEALLEQGSFWDNLRIVASRIGQKIAVIPSDAFLHAALDSPDLPAEEEYRYYPQTFREPYLSRRRKVGWDLYGLLGVGKGDTEGMKRQSAANLRFFGAPVALMLTVDRDLEIGSWLDLGMFVQSLLVAVQGNGLQSCPQAIFARFHPVVRRELAIPESEVVVCGIAIGHADPDAPQNALVPEREPVEGFTTWLD